MVKTCFVLCLSKYTTKTRFVNVFFGVYFLTQTVKICYSLFVKKQGKTKYVRNK